MKSRQFLLILISILQTCPMVLAQVRPGRNKNMITRDFPLEDKPSNLSPATRMLIHDLSEYYHPAARNVIIPARLNRYPLIRENQKIYIGALVKVNSNLDARILDSLGIQMGTRFKDIRSMKIPIEQLPLLAGLKGIEYLETDQKIIPRLDSARLITGVDSVQHGIGLPAGYTGKGVIIGIIDEGFDYTHPMFYDTLGDSLRIARVWNQEDNSGTPPAGLNYGTELGGQSAILGALYSNAAQSHGSHVAGIAGGSGNGTNGKYRGVAPDARMVFVQFGNGQSDIQDGIFYILNYAQSVHLPAVINMSLGTHIGPHDGTSLLDQAIDYYSDYGIIVGAAGNEGDTPLHASHQFSGDTVQTIVTFENPSNPYSGSGAIDIWGSENSSFTIGVDIYDGSGNLSGYTYYISTAVSGIADTTIVNGSDTVQVEISVDSKNINNNKPNMTVYLSNNSASQILTLEITSSNGLIHFWNNSQGGGSPVE